MHLVVLLANPEWRIVRIKTEGHSRGVTINPTLCSLKEIPLRWKEHVFQAGLPSNYKSIIENVLSAGGLSLRCARQACFFSLPTPQDPSSRQRSTIGQDQSMNQEWHCTSKAIAQIMFVFSTSMYGEFKTQNWYIITVAVTRLLRTTTCWQAHWTRWSLLQVQFSLGRKKQDFNHIRRTRKQEKSFSFPAWWSKSWSLQTHWQWFTIWSRLIYRIRTSRLLSCITSWCRNSCSTKR